jgi:anti-sigma B factor antagonist
MKFEMDLRLRQDDTPVITLAGILDMNDVARLRAELKRLVQEGHKKIIVDLDALEYLDSSGLGVLVGALARIREQDGDLPIVVSNPRNRRVFDVTKLSYVFTLYPSLSAVP